MEKANGFGATAFLHDGAAVIFGTGGQVEGLSPGTCSAGEGLIETVALQGEILRKGVHPMEWIQRFFLLGGVGSGKAIVRADR